MDVTIKTPMCVDKAVGFFKAAFSFIRNNGRIALSFCKTHSPLLALIGGVALTTAGFVTAYIWRKRQGNQEVGDPTGYNDKQTKKKRVIQNIVSIGCFVLGTGLQILSYIISAGRINALAKALAVAMNAGSVLGMAKLSNEVTPEEEEKLNIARNTFSFRIDELPCYQDWNGYHSCEVLNGITNQLKRRINLGEHVSWNEVRRQLNLTSVDWGNDIGWDSADSFDWVMCDGWGNQVDKHTQVWASVTGNLQGYRIYFLGMHNMSYFDRSKGKHVRPVVEGDE